MEFTAKQIAELLGGKVDGNPDVRVHSLSKIEDGEPGTLSFLANPKYTSYICNTQASIVIVNNDFTCGQALHTTLIRVEDAYGAFAKLLEKYYEIKQVKPVVSKKASIADSATIGEDTYIGPLAFVGENSTIGSHVKIYPQVYIGDNVHVGDNTVIYAGVTIYCDSKIGNSCIIHSGVVIGADGFGFAPHESKHYKKIIQVGNVVIEDDVEIGANTTIDKATLGSTIIRKGVKLDNLIQVAHNVEIGENTVIAAQTGISGTVKIGSNCLIGGQVGISGHLTIGNDVRIAAQSGISKDIKDGEILMGSPSFAIGEYKKAYVHFRNLDKHIKKLNEIGSYIKKKNDF